ncbi:hypothetical protein DPMN_013785 [Dreissena polymorpha]|uniref:Uncharacterized protein n=1 Tax=Dreissena polymorpha TaxID=45954 RepID=A0A9D4S429_DREPO|nr:hypothetical protein DPMN_013785 [Dreissena polymorpha]
MHKYVHKRRCRYRIRLSKGNEITNGRVPDEDVIKISRVRQASNNGRADEEPACDKGDEAELRVVNWKEVS